MRRHDDAGGDRVVGRMQQGDGAAVGMAQKQRLSDAQLAEQLWQHLKGFAVHVIGVQAALATHIGTAVRLAIALT